MKIIKIQGREIFDSRGIPALECEITLSDGYSVISSVPSGASCGIHEAVELRDDDQNRLRGKGLLKPIDIIETIISPMLIGNIPDVCTIDRFMIELDGTPNKARLGANTLLAVSMAVLRAQAHVERLEFGCYALQSVAVATLGCPEENLVQLVAIKAAPLK